MERKSNLELLRIVSMIMIILHHYADHGGFVFADGEITTNRIILQSIHLFGKMGICVFVLITGYFMVEASFRWKKVLKLILEVQFYSWICFGVTVLSGGIEFTWQRLFMTAFPVTTSLYWFVTTYLILYILSPFLNILIHHLTKRQHLQLILILLTIWSIIPTLLQVDLSYSQLGWFALLYLTAAFLRLYPDEKWLARLKGLRSFFVCYGFVLLTVLILDVFEYMIPGFSVNMEYFGGQNKITTYLCALTLFMAFVNMEIKSSRFINEIASTTFGVYLLHDNAFISQVLWTEWLDTDALVKSPWLSVHLVVAAGCIFCVCVAIDYGRKRLVEIPLLRRLS